MILSRFLGLALGAAAAVGAASVRGSSPGLRIRSDAVADAQQLVTYDEHSLLVKGQRVLFWSGEYHPFRLPVPSLWLDVFQKIKSLGYNGVSFYVDWALVEGTPGVFSADGIFDLQPFLDAAKAAGIYLLARPGPYINAEVSGGGYPGWQARNPATLRTSDPSYINSTSLYMSKVAAIIAKNQITKGGPIILVQPENEYSQGPTCCSATYFGQVEQQLRAAGIVVPFISNDAGPYGHFVPGSGPDAVDIYGHDGYPLGFDCSNPSSWGGLPTNWGDLHEQQSPSTPYSIVEFQGGSFDPWGGVGFAKCVSLLNSQFESVYYKNDISFGVKVFNSYMAFGGTNWGNLGHPGGYSSYDYAAVIAEDRTVSRQKYSEAKLIAHSLRSLPAYLTAVAQSNANATGAYSNNANMFITGVFSNTTKFFVARQADYTSNFPISYQLKVPTSQGNVTIPQLGGSLSIFGRDSKIHVVDGDLQGVNLLYSSAEIFTFQKYTGNSRVLVLYGVTGEQHEFAVTGAGKSTVLEGNVVASNTTNSTTIVNWKANSARTAVSFANGLVVYLINKNAAYNYWVFDAAPSATSAGLPVVNMPTGYLVRNVTISGSSISIVGDLNRTSTIEVLGAGTATSLSWNGQTLKSTKDAKTGALKATAQFKQPNINLPNLATIPWKAINGLPEIMKTYDDSKWTKATLTTTNNTDRPDLNTPTNLYSCDYGYHTGSLVYRGHFTADGTETQLQLSPQGGYAFGYSVWLNNTFIASWAGNANNYYYYGYFDLPTLTNGTNYVLTVLIDHMGNNEDFEAGSDSNKEPRGVMQYQLGSRPLDVITWKLTGNLGGEKYADKVRGPLNEGGMWAERHGFHLPNPPTTKWRNSKGPTEGVQAAGVQFYSTTFDLDLPVGYDIPLSLDFGSAALTTGSNFRCQIFVNGYQYGKFVSNIGPQTLFPVPQGIWNYQGSNTVAVSLWALDKNGATPPMFNLTAGPVVQSGYGPVTLSPAPAWKARPAAY